MTSLNVSHFFPQNVGTKFGIFYVVITIIDVLGKKKYDVSLAILNG